MREGYCSCPVCVCVCRLSVCVSVSVKSHLASGASVRPENAVMYAREPASIRAIPTASAAQARE